MLYYYMHLYIDAYSIISAVMKVLQVVGGMAIEGLEYG